jgi:hypothetical protein
MNRAKIFWQDDSMSLFRDKYSGPLLKAVLIQFCIVFFTGSCVLDEGQTHQAAIWCSVTFWIGTAMILIRRRASPTPGDLAYIRLGLLILNVLGIPAFFIVWWLKGVWP